MIPRAFLARCCVEAGAVALRQYQRFTRRLFVGPFSVCLAAKAKKVLEAAQKNLAVADGR